MTKTKALTKLMLVGTAFAVSIPAGAGNVSAKDYLNEGDNSIRFDVNKDTEGVFTSRNPERAKWYADKGQNRVYKTYRNYFYFYSPVRPRDVKKGVADYSGLYENWYTRDSGDVELWDTSRLLVTTNKSSSLYNQNFKTQAVPLNRVKGTVTGDTYVDSIHVDKYGQFAGRNGEWRYLGYGADGTTVGNPTFPEDYNRGYNALSHPYIVKPWNRNDWSKTFVPGSQYDRAQKNGSVSEQADYKTKLRAINLLRKQNPTFAKESATWWMDRLSLMSAPVNDTAAFRGAWSPEGAERYVEWTLINDENQKNMMVEEMTVTRADNGKVVAKFNRNKAAVEEGIQSYYGDKKLYTGTAYNVQVKVKNLANVATTLNESEIEIGFKKKYNPNIDYPSDFKGGANGNEFNKAVKGKKIAKNASATFTLKNVVIPDDAKDTTLRFSTAIGDAHRIAQDNLDTIDDIGVLPIQVVGQPGDMKFSSIELLNASGSVVKNPVPGEKYKVRYNYKYTGTDIRQATYTKKSDKNGNTWTEFAGYKYPNVKINVKSVIDRTLPGKGASLSGDKLSETIQLNKPVRNGDTLSFTTAKAEVFEVPRIKASASLEMVGTAYDLYNLNGANDSGTKEWNESYDYSVENLQVIPRTERSAVDGKMNVGVSFTAVQTLPNTAKTAGFEQTVDMAIEVDGKVHHITEHMKAGKNKNIVFETTVDAKAGKAIHASVFVNDSAQAWETDLLTQANNQAKTAFDPELVTAFGNPMKNTAGFVTNKMLFPTDPEWKTRTSNAWTQDYTIHDVKGDKVTYTTKAGVAKEFYKYRNEAVTTKSVTQNESYKIEEVLFKSKYTKDNELGKNKDGWVDMRTAQDLPRIKAGYGYELKVTVKYDTNALTSQPAKKDIPAFSNSKTRDGKATVVRPYNVKPNIPNDLFVKTPDNKILSVSGSRSTVPGLVPDANNGKDGRYTFTLKSINTLGVKEEGKIYVGENVKDGEYGIQIWTPVINGIPTKNLKTVSGLTEYTPSQLADFQTVKFEVKGSATDDLVDTIIQ